MRDIGTTAYGADRSVACETGEHNHCAFKPDHVLDGLPEERHTDPMLTLVRVLHVALAAAWFGHKLLIPADLRRSIGAGVEPAEALIVR